MKIRLKFLNSKCCWNERGSYTLEAILLFPLVIIIIILLMIQTIQAMQSNIIYIISSQSADRVAHHWKNSQSHPVTGMFTTINQDPLYWRWTQSTLTNHLLAKKLSLASYGWNNKYQVQAKQTSQLLNEIVTVETVFPWSVPTLWGISRNHQINKRSSESIVDPAEFIRNVMITVYFVNETKQLIDFDAIRTAVAPWLEHQGRYSYMEHPSAFRNHAEAVSYLRTLVNGVARRIPTMHTGKWRLVDAMDSYQVAHQAYIGPKTITADIVDQLNKDKELILRGEVMGVAWHFFRREGESMSGPSPELMSKLQHVGIVIIIHH
jgi:hypothetical protein